MSDPFEVVARVEMSRQLKKFLEQMRGLSRNQVQMLLGGYFSALRDAVKGGTLPLIEQFRWFLSGDFGLMRRDLTLLCSGSVGVGGYEVVARDERADGLTEVDFSKAVFLSGLGPERFRSPEKAREVLSGGGWILPGARQYRALWHDYEDEGEGSVLETLGKVTGADCIFLLGTLISTLEEGACSLALCFVKSPSGRWDGKHLFVDSGWDWLSVAVVLPGYLGRQ